MNAVSDCFFETQRENPKDIVAIGRLTKQKNQQMLIRAFSQIAEKYQINEKRAQAMLVSALKSIRDVEEFQPIKSHLK